MRKKIDFNQYKGKTLLELLEVCKSFDIHVSDCNKQSVLAALLKFFAAEHEVKYDGFLNIHQSHGFLRNKENNFIEALYDAYITKELIKSFGLREGDKITCKIKTNEQKFVQVEEIFAINDINSKKEIRRPLFEDLVPIYPTKQIILERNISKQDVKENVYNTICRIIDLIAPIGFGQRGTIIAPPQTGKTTFIQSIARAILANYPKVKLFILLVGERPEEVTEMKEIAPSAEVFSSTFDETPSNQIKTSEMVFEIAKRQVENGEEVIILMDSITRLVRSYNMDAPSSGKVLSGGIEPSSVHKPKKYFGSARNFKEGSSLTIITTGLVETGSKMDDFIYEEFKGTGNCEIKLDRATANKRIFPALNINFSETRRVGNMIAWYNIHKLLRRHLASMDNGNAMEFLLSSINNTDNNSTFIAEVQKKKN